MAATQQRHLKGAAGEGQHLAAGNGVTVCGVEDQSAERGRCVDRDGARFGQHVRKERRGADGDRRGAVLPVRTLRPETVAVCRPDRFA